MRLLSAGQPRPGTHEQRFIAFQQLQRFAVELQLCALAIQRIDAREQRRIEVNRVPMRRELRRDLALDLQHRGIAVGAGQFKERGTDASQQLPGELQGADRVIEARRIRVVRDRPHLRQLLRHAGGERGQVIGIADAIEWWQLKG